MSPHSANIDRLRVEQQCGGNLARPQPVCVGVVEFFGVVAFFKRNGSREENAPNRTA
jgi:hypothetical protein